MLNFLFICDHLSGGGAERIAVDLMNYMAEHGHNVSLALLDADKIGFKLNSKISQYNLNITFSQSLLRKKGKFVKISDRDEILKIKDFVNPDLVILSHEYAFWLACYFKDKKILYWVHGEFFNFNLNDRCLNNKKTFLLNEYRRVYLEKRCLKKIFRFGDIVVVNQDLKNILNKYLESKIIVIPNGLDKSRYKINNLCNEKEYDAIYVGRLSPEKQPLEVLDIFFNSNLKGKLCIVGDGVLNHQMLKKAFQLGISDRVIFKGWVESVANEINKAKMLLLPSKLESFGLVILEAHFLGVPVVTFNVSSGVKSQFVNDEMISKGLVTPGDFNEFVEKVNQMYIKPYAISNKSIDNFDISRVYLDFGVFL